MSPTCPPLEVQEKHTSVKQHNGHGQPETLLQLLFKHHVISVRITVATMARTVLAIISPSFARDTLLLVSRSIRRSRGKLPSRVESSPEPR